MAEPEAGSTRDLPRPESGVNIATLNRLATDVGAESPRSLGYLVAAYVDQADSWIAELSAAARDGQTEQIAVIAHTLGSSSALLGADGLADLLAEAERQARSAPGRPDELVAAAESVAAEYARVVATLRSQCDLPHPV